MAVRPIDALELRKRMCAICNQDYADEPCEPSDCFFIRVLNETPTLTPQNEPLTLEELSLCNDPVWIKRIADRNLSDDGWAIVEGPRCSTWFNGIPMSWEIRVWWPGSEVADYPKHEDYGKTWLAYRCSPNKGAKDKNIPTNGPLTLEELTLMTEPTPVWWDWVQGWVLARKGMIMSWNGGYYDSEILKGNFYRHPLEGEEKT